MKGLVRSSQLFIKRNASTILTTLGGAGVIATSVLAVKATPKALVLLEQAKKEKGEELTTVETIKVAGIVYIPAVVTGAASIACIFGANVLNKRQQASLVSAYALLDASYKEYKEKVEELYGEGANEHLKEELVKDKYEASEESEDDGLQLFYDDFSGRYFRSTMYDVQQAEYRINRDIHMRGWAELNEFYDYINLDAIDGGEALGWSEGGNLARYWQGWIDFSHRRVTMDDGMECCIVTMFQEPYPCYEDEC